MFVIRCGFVYFYLLSLNNNKKKKRFFYAALNFIPAIFIICILLTIFASLTFKIKDSKISANDAKKVSALEDKLLNDEIDLTSYKDKRNEIEINYVNIQN